MKILIWNYRVFLIYFITITAIYAKVLTELTVEKCSYVDGSYTICSWKKSKNYENLTVVYLEVSDYEEDCFHRCIPIKINPIKNNESGEFCKINGTLPYAQYHLFFAPLGSCFFPNLQKCGNCSSKIGREKIFEANDESVVLNASPSDFWVEAGSILQWNPPRIPGSMLNYFLNHHEIIYKVEYRFIHGPGIDETQPSKSWKVCYIGKNARYYPSNLIPGYLYEGRVYAAILVEHSQSNITWSKPTKPLQFTVFNNNPYTEFTSTLQTAKDSEFTSTLQTAKDSGALEFTSTLQTAKDSVNHNVVHLERIIVPIVVFVIAVVLCMILRKKCTKLCPTQLPKPVMMLSLEDFDEKIVFDVSEETSVEQPEAVAFIPIAKLQKHTNSRKVLNVADSTNSNPFMTESNCSLLGTSSIFLNDIKMNLSDKNDDVLILKENETNSYDIETSLTVKLEDKPTTNNQVVVRNFFSEDGFKYPTKNNTSLKPQNPTMNGQLRLSDVFSFSADKLNVFTNMNNDQQHLELLPHALSRWTDYVGYVPDVNVGRPNFLKNNETIPNENGEKTEITSSDPSICVNHPSLQIADDSFPCIHLSTDCGHSANTYSSMPSIKGNYVVEYYPKPTKKPICPDSVYKVVGKSACSHCKKKLKLKTNSEMYKRNSIGGSPDIFDWVKMFSFRSKSVDLISHDSGCGPELATSLFF